VTATQGRETGLDRATSDASEMNDTTGNDNKKRGQGDRPRQLELRKTVEGGQVRQSFSHGRSKMVRVEVRKKRTVATDTGGRPSRPGDGDRRDGRRDASRDGIAVGLTNEERAARIRALQDARHEEAVREADREAQARREAQRLEDERRAGEEEAARLAAEAVAATAAQAAAPSVTPDTAETEETAAPPAAAEAAEATDAAPAAEAAPGAAPVDADAPTTAATEAAEPGTTAEAVGEQEADDERRGGAKRGSAPKADVRRPAPVAKKGEPRRRSGRLTVTDALDDRGEERVRSLAATRRAREKEKLRQRQLDGADAHKIVRDVVIPETITVQALSNRMAERGADVIKALFKMGVMATINQSLDADTAEVVATEFGHRVKRVSESDVDIGVKGDADVADDLVPRPPVVTVMGHVDHGKTSLLDALRKTDVAAHEAGGITQHIGAYQITLATGDKVTFIDTPGHAAFTQMRARGANVTDIVVLVVAADDGVMPQTVEAINHARAAGVPMIVAVNKIDKPDAKPERVRTELLQHEVVIEAMGGDVMALDVSAKTGQGLDSLVEAILLQAEVLDLRANPNRAAEGVVVEAKMERGRGSVATVLVQRGTLRVGDIFVAGNEWGRVRGLSDATGAVLDEAGPGAPVEVLGLNGTPSAGDDVSVVENEGRAREVTDFRQRKLREAKTSPITRTSFEAMLDAIKEGEAKQLPVVVKADVHGSTEAIVGALEKLGTDEVKVQVLHVGVGGINESDVTLAGASNATIIGFNVRANPQARELAKRDGVEIRYYSIIYDVVDDIRQVLTGMLAPQLREQILGYAEIRQVFAISKVGKVGGCMVTEGLIRRGARVRLLRDDVVIHEGDLSQLKRFKDDVREVKEGFECGAAFASYHDIQEGDKIECFEMQEVARAL